MNIYYIVFVAYIICSKTNRPIFIKRRRLFTEDLEKFGEYIIFESRSKMYQVYIQFITGG